MVNTYP